MSKRQLVKKRMNNPLFNYYGKITTSSLNSLIKLFSSTESSLNTARKLRSVEMAESVGYYEEKYLEHYDQYDIQRKDSSSDEREENYNITPDDFLLIKDELSYLLNSPVCRMRYATMEPNKHLEYHIDQPGKDRFIMVLEGEHVFYIKNKEREFAQIMKPGELWYVNTNWEHKVENISKQQRLALLGCFEYNNT